MVVLVNNPDSLGSAVYVFLCIGAFTSFLIILIRPMLALVCHGETATEKQVVIVFSTLIVSSW
jgi:hypothetical protein